MKIDDIMIHVNRQLQTKNKAFNFARASSHVFRLDNGSDLRSNSDNDALFPSWLQVCLHASWNKLLASTYIYIYLI